MAETQPKANSILHFEIQLDEQKMPEKIYWEADSANGHRHQNECKAMLVALWDGEQQESMKIDLWTNDMRVDEMNLFFYQTFHTLADTFQRATGNDEAALNIKAFAKMFGENTEVVKKVD
jgi:gliding motility-associated protein GldC